MSRSLKNQVEAELSELCEALQQLPEKTRTSQYRLLLQFLEDVRCQVDEFSDDRNEESDDPDNDEDTI